MGGSEEYQVNGVKGSKVLQITFSNTSSHWKRQNEAEVGSLPLQTPACVQCFLLLSCCCPYESAALMSVELAMQNNKTGPWCVVQQLAANQRGRGTEIVYRQWAQGQDHDTARHNKEANCHVTPIFTKCCWSLMQNVTRDSDVVFSLRNI